MDTSNAATSPPVANSLNFQSVGLFFLLFLVIWKIFRGSKKNLPPGPWRWPILGNIPALRQSPKQVHEILTDWAQQYGSVMTVGLQLGNSACVVLSDINAVKEALVKQADHFKDRFVSPLTEKLNGVQGSFVWQNGDADRVHRRFALSAFRSLGVGKKGMELKINEEIRYLVECFEAEAETNQPFDPLLLVHNAVSNIICTISFGYRFDYSDPEFRKMLRAVNLMMGSSGIGAMGNFFPFLIHTPLFSKLRGYIKTIIAFTSGIVREHQDSYDPNDFRDFIDLYIAETKQQERDGAGDAGHGAAVLNEQNIWMGIFELFAGGTDTTSNTVLWLIKYMLTHSEMQDKIQTEIGDVIGNDRQPSCEDRASMPYTNAVIMEMHRWRPVVPFTLPYKTSQETRLLGCTIPKGTMVIANMYALMHDPKVWQRPEEFNPARFLTKDGKKVVTPDAFIPFSIGRRSCLGEGLARMEVFLFVTNLFQRFTFKLPEGDPPPSMVGVSGSTLVPGPFKACAVKR